MTKIPNHDALYQFLPPLQSLIANKRIYRSPGKNRTSSLTRSSHTANM